MRKIGMIVEKTGTGYSAYAKRYSVYTAGRNLEELKKNMIEALNLYFKEKGKSIDEAALLITLDLPQFFNFYKVINAKALGNRIGMNQSLLAQYINGTKTPSAKQADRIILGIRQLGKELADLRFLI
jgi:predicted RNase H-like HicB family nuclease